MLGVHLKSKGKFQAQIRVNSKLIRLGVFVSPEEASEAYLSAKRKLHEGCTL